MTAQGSPGDQFILWLWESSEEQPVPFARIDNLTATEMDWLQKYLQTEASERFLIVENEKYLNPYNLTHTGNGPRWVHDDNEIKIHRTSFSECKPDALDHWLEVSTIWERLRTRWDGEHQESTDYVYAWAKTLRNLSDSAVKELLKVRATIPPAAASSEAKPVDDRAIAGENAGSDVPDGPFGLDGFRLDGVKMCGLSQVQQRLLNKLHTAKGEAVSVHDLIGPGLVWEDATAIEGNAVGAMRTRVNKLLKESGSIHRVETADAKTKLALVRGGD